MPTMNMSWEQREALARALGVSAYGLTGDLVIERLRALKDRRERAFEDSTGILKIDRAAPMPATRPTATKASAGDEEAEAVLDGAVARMRALVRE